MRGTPGPARAGPSPSEQRRPCRRPPPRRPGPSDPGRGNFPHLPRSLVNGTLHLGRPAGAPPGAQHVATTATLSLPERRTGQRAHGGREGRIQARARSGRPLQKEGEQSAGCVGGRQRAQGTRPAAPKEVTDVTCAMCRGHPHAGPLDQPRPALLNGRVPQGPVPCSFYRCKMHMPWTSPF